MIGICFIEEKMRDHEKLRAFQLADEIVLLTYEICKKFPKEEKQGLASQMRRASVSVASNIVEGAGRENKKDFLRFLYYSYSSLRELHYQAGLSFKLGYISEPEFIQCEGKIIETEKVLAAYIRYNKKTLN